MFGIQEKINQKVAQISSIEKKIIKLRFVVEHSLNINDKSLAHQEINYLAGEMERLNKELDNLMHECTVEMNAELEKNKNIIDDNLFGDEEDGRNVDDIHFNISTIDGALQGKYHWMADIEAKIQKLSPEEIFGQSHQYSNLKKDFFICKNDIEGLQNILDKLNKELEERDIADSLKMDGSDKALAESIVESIKHFMSENFPHINAVVSTNIDVSFLVLTEKPSSPDIIVDIGNRVNRYIISKFSDVIDTQVIVSVGQMIGNTVSAKSDDERGAENIAKVGRMAQKRFNALVESGQIPAHGSKILIPVEREELQSCLKSIQENGMAAIKSVDYGVCSAGDIVILCTKDGKEVVSSPFIVEGQSEEILKDFCLTFLKKLSVRKVW